MNIEKIENFINENKGNLYEMMEEYLKERSEEIKNIPRTAFLCIYKKDHLQDSREFYEIYKNRLLKLVYEFNSSRAIYLDCDNSKLVYYNKKPASYGKLVECIEYNTRSFNIDEKINYYNEISNLPLDISTLIITKTKRNDPEISAKNYLFLVMERNEKCNFKLTYEDFAHNVNNSEEFLNYIKKENWDDLKQEYIIRSATRLLKK